MAPIKTYNGLRYRVSKNRAGSGYSVHVWPTAGAIAVRLQQSYKSKKMATYAAEVAIDSI